MNESLLNKWKTKCTNTIPANLHPKITQTSKLPKTCSHNTAQSTDMPT